MALATLLGAGCGEEGPRRAAELTPGRLAGTLAKPHRAAPALALRNSRGRRIALARYRGKAVLVTFIYSHCPDVCPLIVGNLRTVQTQLGRDAKDLQIVAVSVDPEGDTPRAVNEFLAARRMTGRMEYLLGSRPQLERVWRDWGIVSGKSHSALVYGIDARGRITTLYPTSFKPAEIVHDVPILAAG
jgi:protein SCO1/2